MPARPITHILVAHDQHNVTVHISSHASLTEAERKADQVSKKTTVNLTGAIYDIATDPAPDRWRRIRNIAL